MIIAINIFTILFLIMISAININNLTLLKKHNNTLKQGVKTSYQASCNTNLYKKNNVSFTGLHIDLLLKKIKRKPPLINKLPESIPIAKEVIENLNKTVKESGVFLKLTGSKSFKLVDPVDLAFVHNPSGQIQEIIAKNPPPILFETITHPIRSHAIMPEMALNYIYPKNANYSQLRKVTFIADGTAHELNIPADPKIRQEIYNQGIEWLKNTNRIHSFCELDTSVEGNSFLLKTMLEKISQNSELTYKTYKIN